ncbi:acyl-ACP thioesterase domain-containing protein [uncultured Acetobacterium sp.]|uniref:acyl-[acyl-carrier-protein] thioesterase n=1 Tax=uncultured Acetobacterium sp. TaxID=217139 RepID=UPI0025F3E3A7|nr:acyl-ACP thioesterase domain-containing protein [uncultured Acetobacterium sp.]
MSLVYQEKKRVACYESDSTEKMLPTTAMNYFQEASTNQGNQLGLGGDYLKANNLAWFLVKYVIRFNDYPRYQDEVTITTRATGMDKFCATRRFTIEDASGAERVIADTQWLLINRDTEKMERIDEHPEMDAYQCFEKGEPIFKKIAKINQIDLEKSFSVRFLDIDFNKHVNHVKYLAWAIEVLPLEVVKTKQLSEAKMVYKAQCFYGDQIRALGEQLEENHYRIEIVNQDNTVLCQLELILT